jgi:hypothetical protein
MAISVSASVKSLGTLAVDSNPISAIEMSEAELFEDSRLFAVVAVIESIPTDEKEADEEADEEVAGGCR